MVLMFIYSFGKHEVVVQFCSIYYCYFVFLLQKASNGGIVYYFIFSASSVGFSLTLGLGFVGFIKFLLWVIFVDCIGVGLLIATLSWQVSYGLFYFCLKFYSYEYNMDQCQFLKVIRHVINLIMLQYLLIFKYFYEVVCNNIFKQILDYLALWEQKIIY